MSRSIILPAFGGIQVSMTCGQERDFEYTCIPSHVDIGDLTCIVLQKKNQLIDRRRRSVEENHEENSISAELQIIKTEFAGVIEEWQDMAPSVIGCYSSVAGIILNKQK